MAQDETKRAKRIKCFLCGEAFDSLEELAKHDIGIHALRRKNADVKKEVPEL